MKQYIEIACPHCGQNDLVKNGHSENGTQRYRCKACRRSVQWEYTYRAWQPEVKAQIEDLPLNGSGVREISRTLKIAKSTVIAELKKNSGGGQHRLCRIPQNAVIRGARSDDLCGSR